MIITMRRDAGFFTVKGVVDALVKMGWDVQVRNSENGEQAVIAVLGSALGPRGHLVVERLSGVESCEASNDLFTSVNGKGFLEAWEWLRSEKVKSS